MTEPFTQQRFTFTWALWARMVALDLFLIAVTVASSLWTASVRDIAIACATGLCALIVTALIVACVVKPAAIVIDERGVVISNVFGSRTIAWSNIHVVGETTYRGLLIVQRRVAFKLDQFDEQRRHQARRMYGGFDATIPWGFGSVVEIRAAVERGMAQFKAHQT